MKYLADFIPIFSPRSPIQFSGKPGAIQINLKFVSTTFNGKALLIQTSYNSHIIIYLYVHFDFFAFWAITINKIHSNTYNQSSTLSPHLHIIIILSLKRCHWGMINICVWLWVQMHCYFSIYFWQFNRNRS